MSRKQKRVFRPGPVLIILAAATLALITVRANNSRLARRAQVISAKEISQTAVAVPLERGSLQESMEAELITVLPKGFEPAEIQRPAGKFLLAIDNRSGVAEINLRLMRVNGSTVHELRIRRERPDLRQVIELASGVYRLSEADHPDWVGQLTITER